MADKINIDEFLPEELQDQDGGDEYEEVDIITIEDEEGVEQDCHILAIFEIEAFHQEYVALLPLDQLDAIEDDEADAEVFFYRYAENGDDIELSTLESDEEFNAVREVFEQIMEEEDED